MKNYIGVKEVKAIKAEKHTCTKNDCEEGIQGYKVIYEDGYQSWSPKQVFEEAYTEVSKDKQLVREKLCEIFENTNKINNIFVPQKYVLDFLNFCEENQFTFKK